MTIDYAEKTATYLYSVATNRIGVSDDGMAELCHKVATAVVARTGPQIDCGSGRGSTVDGARDPAVLRQFSR